MIKRRRCLSCNSTALITDWKQGDVICTDCGVVNEDHVQETKSEWTDFNDVEDIIKGLPPSARCGSVQNDESRWIGGLQPTTLSRAPFGGTYTGPLNTEASSSATLEKRLKRTQRRIETMVDKAHTKQIKEAELARRILLKRSKRMSQKNRVDGNGSHTHHDDLSPEEIFSLQETASSIPVQSSLMHDKWSLERALLLHGSVNEAASALSKALSISDQTNASHSKERMIEIEKKVILSRMEKPDRTASRDLYYAYAILSKTVQKKLKLPTIIFQECTRYMCQYVSQKNGFHVKGIVSREVTTNSETNSSKIATNTERRRKKKIQEENKENNKEKQMVALIASLIYVTAKKHGVGRSLKDLCLVFESHPQIKSHPTSPRTPQKSSNILKPKYVSKAVNELKLVFPELFQSLSNPSLDAANLVQHVGEKLLLPSAAIGSIRALALHCGKEQMDTGIGAGSRPSIVCAGVTYFVCRAAEVMQRLAKQALLDAEVGKSSTASNEFQYGLNGNDDAFDFAVKSSGRKRSREKEKAKDVPAYSKKRKSAESTNLGISISTCDVTSNAGISVKKDSFQLDVSRKNKSSVQTDFKNNEVVESADMQDFYEEIKIKPMAVYSSNVTSDNDNDNDASTVSTYFDALSSDPIAQTHSNKELEVLQGWFSWSNQSSWSRELTEIGSACDVSKVATIEYYKKVLHPRRSILLPVIQEYLKKCDEADVCYLVDISSAAPLMILGH